MTEDAWKGPSVVAMIGDWHGNTAWALGVLDQIAEWKITHALHLGDFGIWPGPSGKWYLDQLEERCAEHGIFLDITPGNHEDYSQINSGPKDTQGRRVFRPHIRTLPRGYRWNWHGRKWLSLGGGISIDRVERILGRSYWPEEAITLAEAEAVIAAGHADVMVCHDVGSAVVHSFGPQPTRWAADIAKTEAHRDQLQTVVDAVQPSYFMHGHLHRAYERMCDRSWGSTRVTGLDCDGAWSGNWAALDVRTMEWVKEV